MQQTQEHVRFDVRLKSSASGKDPTLDNIEEFFPESEHIEICRLWFKQQGVAVYATDFGLSGETSQAIFEKIFKVKLIPSKSGGEGNGWIVEGTLQVHPSIADYIDQVTLTVLPELF